MRPLEERKDIARLDRNIERYPIFFVGSEKSKQKIEQKMFEEKKPLIIAREEREEGQKTLSLSPSSVHGLPGGSEQDVFVAVMRFVREIRPKLGYYPKRFLIPLTEYPRLMCLIKQGPLYKKIIKSLETTSECAIYHDSLFKTRKGKGEIRLIEKKKLHLLRLIKIHKEEYVTKTGLKTKKYFTEIELEDWLIQNLENYYTTEIDSHIYFEKLNSSRARKLYNFLTMHQFQKSYSMTIDELVDLLWIREKEGFLIRQAIRRAIQPLIKADFLEDSIFEKEEIVFIFKNVKVRRLPQPSIAPEEKSRIDSLVLMMLEELGDIKSEKCYRKIAQSIPEEIIHLCLGLTKETRETQGIRGPRGAVFIDHIKRECQKRGIRTPFRAPKI